MEDDLSEKFMMNIENLSPYYVLSVLVSVSALVFSFWYNRQCQKQIAEKMKQNEQEIEDYTKAMRDTDPLTLNDTKNDLDSQTDDSLDTLQSRIKVARHQAIVNHLSAKMTPEQLVEEKQTEKAQLEAIFSLLKEQQEKFHVSDMTELEQQLSLYR